MTSQFSQFITTSSRCDQLILHFGCIFGSIEPSLSTKWYEWVCDIINCTRQYDKTKQNTPFTDGVTYIKFRMPYQTLHFNKELHPNIYIQREYLGKNYSRPIRPLL